MSSSNLNVRDPLRIAVWHNLPSGGGKRALYYHVKGLVERGHHVEAWCPSTADQSYLPLGSMIHEHVLPLEWPSAPFGNGLTQSVLRYRDFERKIKAMQHHCYDCAQEIDQGDFDVLFANSCMFLGSSPIGRFVDKPSVLYLQEPYRSLYEALPVLPWIALPAPRRFWWSPKYLRYFIPNAIDVQRVRIQLREELSAARAFDLILTNSNFSRESVLRAYGLNSSVCHLGVDMSLFERKSSRRERFVIGVGAFYPAKNIEFVIKAIAAIPEARPTLMWVGNSGSQVYVDSLVKLAQSLGIVFDPRQRVSDAELVELLSRATVMAYAPRLEPFGYVPLEANACELPVVAVAEGGIRETVVHGVNGLLVAHDPEAMASGLQQVLADPALARNLGEQGREWVRNNWSLDKATSDLETFLFRAIAPQPISALNH